MTFLDEPAPGPVTEMMSGQSGAAPLLPELERLVPLAGRTRRAVVAALALAAGTSWQRPYGRLVWSAGHRQDPASAMLATMVHQRVDSATLTILSSNRAHDGSPKSMAISPDGSMVATGASDGLVRVWDGPTGALLHQIPFDGQAQGVAFIDDTHLAVTPSGGSLLIVTLDPRELVDITRSSLTRGFDEAECIRFNIDPCPSLDEITAGTTSAVAPLRSAPDERSRADPCVFSGLKWPEWRLACGSVTARQDVPSRDR